ncbi:MAG: hypothetical protein K9L70_06695 [Thiohalocapsa sp.]|jgi:hypothetical protein|nr:hypothetical protein [Thiohalocapsa sp.]MCF7992902.1 hypothetical protein [Thiohalocapsa sp.]
MLQTLFETGRIIDLILLMVIAEAALIAWYRRRTGHGAALAELWPTLLSGACLLGALRVALSDGWWGWIAAAVTLSLFAHVADLARRWR